MGVIGEFCQPRNYSLRKPSRSAKAIPGSVVAIPTTIPKILAIIGKGDGSAVYWINVAPENAMAG